MSIEGQSIKFVTVRRRAVNVMFVDNIIVLIDNYGHVVVIH